MFFCRKLFFVIPRLIIDEINEKENPNFSAPSPYNEMPQAQIERPKTSDALSTSTARSMRNRTSFKSSFNRSEYRFVLFTEYSSDFRIISVLRFRLILSLRLLKGAEKKSEIYF